MKPAALSTFIPAYGKAVADCLQSAKDTFSLTHEEETSVAHKCVDTQDKVVEACLERLREGGFSPEEEARLWEQVAKASERQGGIHARQVESGRESRNAIIVIGGVALIGAVAIANPKLARSLAGTVGKKILTKAPRALAA